MKTKDTEAVGRPRNRGHQSKPKLEDDTVIVSHHCQVT